MEFSSVLTYAGPALAGALVTYLGSRLPSVRSAIGRSTRAVGRAINFIRRFIFASRRTRRHARADFISGRSRLSLPVLEITLFRWYDKHSDLVEYVRRVYRENRSDSVKRRVADLLWDQKPASSLRINDIVHHNQYLTGHVIWTRTSPNSEWVYVLLDATANSIPYRKDASVRVVRGEWCPIENCQYCDTTLAQIEVLGTLWADADEARRELKEASDKLDIANRELKGLRSHLTPHSAALTREEEPF